MKIPSSIQKLFSFDPGFHLSPLRHVENYLEDLLKNHPSPNQRTGEGADADSIAENYEAFLDIKNKVAEAADACEAAIQASRKEAEADEDDTFGYPV